MEIRDFIGLTFKSVAKSNDDEVLVFETVDDRKFEMYHEQDCCESVYLEDVNGDLDYLVDSPILNAFESTNFDGNPSESATWTFYHMNTAKGFVTLRWYGQSNGYYSESVDIKEIKQI